MQRAALAEVVINLRTTRLPSNDNNGGDADIEDALYPKGNRDVDTFRFTNISKILGHKVNVSVANRTVHNDNDNAPLTV